MDKLIVYSPYGENVSTEVVQNQRNVIEQFLPSKWIFEQQLVKGEFNHGLVLDAFVDSCSDDDFICLLDIDCIPLHSRALQILQSLVNKEDGKGLVGAVQRANHIENDKHLYVGPFCMAFTKAYYKEVGSPSFIETQRGDVGEELTYRWTERAGFTHQQGIHHRYADAIHFIWPSYCTHPMWDLVLGMKFGLGTTYGTAGYGPRLFYHSFNARDKQTQAAFISKCKEVVEQNQKERVVA